MTSSLYPAVSSGRSGDEQEDPAAGRAPDDVAKEPQAVLVGPLQVVQDDRKRAHRGQFRDGHGGQVVGPQELLVRGETSQGRVVPTGDRVERSPHGRSGRGGGGELLDGLASEDGAGEQEGAAQLLVGSDRRRNEALGRRPGPGPP